MSLLSETVATVLEGKFLKYENLLNVEFGNIGLLDGYEVISGSVEPRTTGGNLLVLDDTTGEPLVLPPNSAPYKFVYLPTVPLQNLDPSGSGIAPFLSSDTSFTLVYNPFGTQVTMNQMTPAGCTMPALVTQSVQLDNFVGYPFLCMSVFGPYSFTAGKVQIYLFYKSF